MRAALVKADIFLLFASPFRRGAPRGGRNSLFVLLGDWGRRCPGCLGLGGWALLRMCRRLPWCDRLSLDFKNASECCDEDEKQR